MTAQGDNTGGLPLIVRVLRWRWRLLVVLAVVGGLVGAGASMLFSPGFQTTATVLLQGPREPDELLTESQLAMSTVVLERTAAALNQGDSAADLRGRVAAVVGDGNVIEIVGTADTPEGAARLADLVAAEYVRFSAQLAGTAGQASAQLFTQRREDLQEQIAATNERITELHGAAERLSVETVQVRTELEALRASLGEAMTALDEAAATAGRSDIVILGQAPLPQSAAAPTTTHFAVGGGALAVLLGLLGHLFAAHTDRRLREASEIAAAVGAPLLGNLDAAVELPEPTPAGWRARLRRELRLDVPWRHLADSPVDEDGRAVHYRRVADRLRDSDSAPPLMLIARDDATARQAVRRLGSRFTVAEVAADRPTVPTGDAAGVVVAVSAGSRTAWELVGIAEACADAGLTVVGTLVTHQVRPDDKQSAEDEQAVVLAGAP